MNSILLVEVPARYGDALKMRAQGADTSFEAMSGAISVPERTYQLVVMAGSGEDPDLVSRVRAVAKVTHPAPLVLLGLGLQTDQVVRAVRAGVCELLELPGDPGHIAGRVLELLAEIGQTEPDGDLVGKSPAMKRVREQLRGAARVPSTVLLLGDTGTGKGLAARRIHALSERAAEPFIHVDCGALTPSLIESELFGHERGAFTGASALRRGRFEAAGQGTLFLDEIGELDLGMQRKLLRALEDRVFERVGNVRTVRLMARIVAATNRDLRREVSSGNFRQDLYFRLNVLRIEIPPLRERLADLALLVPAAVDRVSRSLGIPAPRIADDFYAHLADHPWPGNVRELFNLVERILVSGVQPVLRGALLDEFLDDVREAEVAPRVVELEPSSNPDEATVAAAALRDTGGNISRAARRIGVARGTLRYRIKKHGLEHLLPDD